MRSRATALAAEKQNAVALDEHRIAEFADCTPEALADAKAEVAALGALRKRLADAEPRVAELVKSADEARSAAEAAGRVMALLQGVKVPKQVRSLHAERDKAVAARDTAVKAREDAENALAKAESEAKAAPEPAALEAILDAHAQLAEVGGRIAEFDGQIAAAAPALDDAKAAFDAAAHAAVHAQQAHDAAVEDNAATALVAALVVGEPCPVCEQIVSKKPKARAGEKGKAKKELDAARKAEADARDAVAKIENALSAVKGQREAYAKQLGTFEKKVKGQPDVKALTAQLAAAKAARSTYDGAQKAFTAAVARERAAGKDVERFDADLVAARRECTAQRDPLVSAGLEPPHIEGALVEAWDALVAWAIAEIPNREAARTEQTKRAAEHEAAVTALLDELRRGSGRAGRRVARPRCSSQPRRMSATRRPKRSAWPTA